jgi:drug/metabolite transporter (DMT)-like permease
VTEASLLKPRVLIPFILVTLIWGSTWIVIKDQLNMVPPSWSVTYRFLTGGIVMMIVAALTKAPLRLGRDGHIFAALLGVAQFMFNFNFVYRAELYITSGLVAVVFALLFVPNALFARVFVGHHVSKRFVAGSAIAVTGIALLFINEARGDDAAQTATLTGIAFTLAGVLSASAANVMQASKRAKALPMAVMLGWAMLWGAGFDAAYAWLTAGPPVMDWRPSYLLGVLFLGVVASALAFSLYFTLIRNIGPARAAYSSTIIPVIAMGFSTVFEDFIWTGLAVAGSVVALAGMIVALSAPKAEQQ